MRRTIAILCSLISLNALADIKTINETFKTEITATKALSLPDGVLQILGPRLSLDNNAYEGDDALFVADSITANVICSEVKKSLIDFQTTYVSRYDLGSDRDMVSFDANGAMKTSSIVRYDYTYPVIYSVSCK